MASETIYDYPQYYDLLFGWDRSQEADFYHRTFARCGVATGERILEVACGTGQVAILLAQRDWQVTGLDISPAMVAFLRKRVAAEKVEVETLCADMTTFSTEPGFGAAYNPMSSFRLLHDDGAAEAHLRRIAAALRSRGIYVLDMEFVANAEEPAVTTTEAWEMTQGPLTVRAENDAVYVNDRGVERVLAWGTEGHLRAYTVAAFGAVVAAVPDLTIESWHLEWSRATGVSEFRVHPSADAPAAGRSMVVLRRR
jgi:SAM-dependent methyltransferase